MYRDKQKGKDSRLNSDKRKSVISRDISPDKSTLDETLQVLLYVLNK